MLIFCGRGYLTDEGTPTASGLLAAKCPLDPIWYHAIEVGVALGCAQDMVDIAIVCNNQNSILARRPKYYQVGDESNSGFAAGPSDHVKLANAFNLYLEVREDHLNGKEPRDLDAWCLDNFLDYRALEGVRMARRALGPFLKDTAKIKPSRSSVTQETVLKALAIAFCTRSAIYHGGSDEYRTVHGNITARLDPRSSLVDRSYEWVVFSGLSMTGSNTFMSTCTAVNPEWLMVKFLVY